MPSSFDANQRKRRCKTNRLPTAPTEAARLEGFRYWVFAAAVYLAHQELAAAHGWTFTVHPNGGEVELEDGPATEATAAACALIRQTAWAKLHAAGLAALVNEAR